MSNLILITKVQAAGGRLVWPGTVFNDAFDDVAAITGAGGRLVSASVAAIAQAAVRATTIKLRGGTIDAAEAVMVAAANAYDSNRTSTNTVDISTLTTDLATLQSTVDGLGSASGVKKIVESFRLDLSYTAFGFLGQMSPVYNAGVIDDTTLCAAQAPLFQYCVPQIVVGDSQNAVFDGTGTTNAGPAVTVTVTGVDIAGNERSCVFTTNGAGVYQPATPYALRTPLTRVQTSASLERKLGVYSGKGFALANPFVAGTLEIGASGATIELDTPTYTHPASGTVIPSFEWNAAETTVTARYTPAG